MNGTFAKIKFRVIASVMSFGVFLSAAISIAFMSRSDLRYYVIVPFIISYILLPRKTYAKGQGEAAEIARKTNIYLSYLRVFYFILAIFVLLGLPKLV